MKASAPGKVILFGEHAVVYGRHAVVTAINLRCYAEALKSSTFRIESPIATTSLDFEKHPYVSYAIKRFMEVKPIDGVKIKIESEIPIASGLGSSAAVTVAVLKALDAEFDAGLSDEELFELARKVELDVQGRGSGTDPFVSTYGGAWLIPERKPLDLGEFRMLIVNSGEESITSEMVAKVARLRDELGDVVERIFDVIDTISLKAFAGEGEISRLMAVNQCMLKAIGVSTKRIDEIVEELEGLGIAAKITGAGGGGSVVGVGSDEALQRAAKLFSGIIVEPEREGARVED
ncbi:mevalonate kinase [Archaeoglobus veneficus]|uniref:Mevalonate kinase n=1 Tax=Archaeoglobus veneficus (strain DSM 11195 / SNP6) TaxID=693661 RepID=F2KQQ8_ARCVS|nr:mevalonate kinase [Archaeoglobus veneficus]AEA46620.1 mevalonate kinase [Archaeoglobus veneficus SNP6]